MRSPDRSFEYQPFPKPEPLKPGEKLTPDAIAVELAGVLRDQIAGDISPEEAKKRIEELLTSDGQVEPQVDDGAPKPQVDYE